MAIIFQSSFDAASPFAAWSTATGVTTVTGRTLNGAQIQTSQVLNKIIGGTSSSTSTGTTSGTTTYTGSVLYGPYYAGAACKTNSFAGKLMTFDTSTSGDVSAWVQHLGDGRVQLGMTSWLGGSALTSPSTFVMNQGEFYYFELAYNIVSVTVTPDSDPTKCDVSAVLHLDCLVNNVNIFPGFFSGLTYSGSAVVPWANLRSFLVDQLGNSPPGGGNLLIWDDVYIASDKNYGDGSVPPTDASFDVNVVDTRLTQQIFEASTSNADQVRLTQQLLEIIYVTGHIGNCYAYMGLLALGPF